MTQTKTTTKTTTNENLPPNPFVSEILALVSKQKTNAKRIEVLREYENQALKSVLIWNFDDTVITVLPAGDVPFKPNEAPAGTEHTSLRQEHQYLYNFIKGGNDTLPAVRRETMFIQILENLHPEEAEILVLTKDKKLQSKYKITKDLVSEAYPDIQWGGRS
jgi:hypothetical protein